MSLASEKLLASLKRYNPTAVVRYNGEEEKRISVSPRRKKWGQVVAVIEAGPWSRVEMLDKGDALLAVVENTDPAGDLADLGAPHGRTAELERLLGVVLRAQKEAMAFKNEETQGLFKAMSEMQREQTQAVKALTGLYQEQLKVVRETARERAEADMAMAEAESGDSIKQLIDAAPVIMQVLPMLKKLLGDGGAAVANGVKGS